MAHFFPILLRFIIVLTIWGAVWHYTKPQKKENRLLGEIVLVVALLLAAGLISMTN